jgi:hypothetical protein
MTGIAVTVTLVLALAACGHAEGGQPPVPAAASCRYDPSSSATASTPEPSRSGSPDDAWANRVAENNAFRQRRPLTPAVLAAGNPYVIKVCQALSQLRTTDQYGAAAVQAVLTAAGLSQVQARPPGRLDLGGGDGLVFAGWTGTACVFGTHRTDLTEVDLGSQIADGGCLPAAS